MSKIKKKKIAILGCDFIGKPLKEKLEGKGHEVNCLSDDVNMDCLVGFYACDSLIIAIPPSDTYLDIIEDVYFSLSLNEALVTQVIFLSSTSFYDNEKIIIEAEDLAKIKDENTVILRLGEVMGADKIAGIDTKGQIIEDSSTNYVHIDDVIGILENLIEKKLTNKIFNVVAPIQSTKKEIFTQNSKQFGFELPDFSNNTSDKKALSSDVLCEVLGYTFKKKDVKEFWN